MADLIKGSDLAFAQQFFTFQTKLGAYAATLGLTPAELAAVEADREFLAFVILAIAEADNYKQDWTKLKNELRKGGGGTVMPPFPVPVDTTTTPPVVAPDMEKRFRDLVKRIKSHPNYTPAMGEDLGIVADETDFDPDTFKTALKLKLFMGYVQIDFTKKGVDGVKIYARLKGQSEWTFLALDTKSPYLDNRPLANAGVAETREYMAYGVIDDVQLPTASDVAVVVFPG